MVAAFLKEPEVWGAWYEQQLFYFLLLDRFRPKEGRVTTLPGRLAKREVPVPIALREIIASTYFNDRNPGNDTFCTVVLEQCNGLVVQERKNLRTLKESKKMYDGYAAKIFKEKGASQSDFVRICFSQASFYEHLLRRTWAELHETPIPEERLEEDVARFRVRPVVVPRHSRRVARRAPRTSNGVTDRAHQEARSRTCRGCSWTLSAACRPTRSCATSATRS